MPNLRPLVVQQKTGSQQRGSHLRYDSLMASNGPLATEAPAQVSRQAPTALVGKVSEDDISEANSWHIRCRGPRRGTAAQTCSGGRSGMVNGMPKFDPPEPTAVANESDRYLPVTVVIATLGGPSLLGTIAALQQGNAVPSKIVVCVPADATLYEGQLKSQNIQLVRTEERGQVQQRIAGFRVAVRQGAQYVLQLDDDLEFSGEQLEKLLAVLIAIGGPCAVAPVLLRRPSREPYTRLQRGIPGLVASAIATLIHGAPFGSRRMGRLAKSGRNFGVDPTQMVGQELRVDWLPGGCVLHASEDLILSNYYPYRGKAFAEDVIHSCALRRHGVQLWVTRSAECALERDVQRASFRQRVNRLRALDYASSQCGVSPARRIELLLIESMRTLVSYAVRELLRVGVPPEGRNISQSG